MRCIVYGCKRNAQQGKLYCWNHTGKCVDCGVMIQPLSKRCRPCEHSHKVRNGLAGRRKKFVEKKCNCGNPISNSRYTMCQPCRDQIAARGRAINEIKSMIKSYETGWINNLFGLGSYFKTRMEALQTELNRSLASD